MDTNKTRLMAISGATLALIVASTAMVSAHPGDDEDRSRFGGQRGQAASKMGGHGFAGLREMKGQFRAGVRDRIGGRIDDFERRETTLQTADGTTTKRVEQGALESATETALTFTVGSETVTVTIDEDTQAIAFGEQDVESRRGRTRTRVMPSEVSVAELEAGAEIVVWSDAEDGGEFLASRIVVRPALEEATDETADDATDIEAATEEAAALPVLDA